MAEGTPAKPVAAPGWLGMIQHGSGGHLVAGTVLPPLLTQGTLLAEFVLQRGQRGQVSLVHLVTDEDWPRLLSFEITAEGRFVVRQRQGEARASVSLDAAGLLGSGGRFRVSYRWQSPARRSLLTLESLDGGVIRQAAGVNPLPMPRQDLLALLTRTGAALQGAALDWLALSAALVPVGPGAAFAPATPIETPEGPRPAALIRSGDWVQTADAGAQQVLWSGRVALPTLGALAPVRLAAGRFTRNEDVWVLPHTRIAVRDAAVEYLFGTESVLVETRHLVDGVTASRIERPGVLGWHGILLRGHHLLMADGLHLESLYAGALSAAPELAATTALAGLAASGDLPTHRRPALRELYPYEAASLAGARAQLRAPVAA